MFRKDVNSALSSKYHKKIGKINYSSQSSPSLKPKKLLKQRRKVVFVNPDDDHYLYWWPALVVPEIEYNLFKQSYDDSNNFKIPNENEILVCYFEDGSFSVIPESDSVPFSLTSSPYTKYISDPNISTAFKNDNAVKLAKLYLETGEIPSTFLWLKDIPSEDKEKDDKINEIGKIEERKKKLLSNSYLQKRREKKEKEISKKSPKLQNKSSPVVRLSNIKNTQSQEFKHNKLSDLKNKQYISNNGLMKHSNKNNDSSVTADKGDSNSSIHHHGNIKNEINRLSKSNSISSNINNNAINGTSSVISSGSINNRNELSKQSVKYKNIDHDNNSISTPHPVKSHSISETLLHDSKSYDSQDENPSTSSIKIRSRKVSTNREKSRDSYPIKEDDTIILPEYLTKPLIFNIKKQKLQQQQEDDESDILSIFPEPKKKRLKKTLDAVQNFVNQSINKEKSSNNQNIFPLPPIQITDF